MNFGKWIVVAFVFFTLFIGTLVTVCVREDVSLVSKDYYKEELAYQEQIKRISNTSDLKVKPGVTKTNDGRLQISFNTGVEVGELKLFCPSNKDMDRTFPLESATRIQWFGITDLQRGMYRAKISWSMEGKEFYHEEVIYL